MRYSIFLILALVFTAACGSSAGGEMKVISEKSINDGLKVAILNPEGKLKNGDQEIAMRFTDGSGKPVEMKAASLNFNMPAMGSMAEMNDAAQLNTTETPGYMKGKVNLQMAGEWIAQISYEGKESGKTTITMTAY